MARGLTDVDAASPLSHGFKLEKGCHLSGSLFLFHPCLDGKPDDSGNDESKDDEFDVLGILADFVVQLVFRHDGVQIPSQSGQDGVPASCTDGGI